MSKLFQNLAKAIHGSDENSLYGRKLVNIDGQLFAVARSRDEMARLMRIHDRSVAGYVLQNHV